MYINIFDRIRLINFISIFDSIIRITSQASCTYNFYNLYIHHNEQITGVFFRVTIAEGGARELAKGWAPTLFGYSVQGLGKFGLYEMFKVFYTNILGEVCDLFFP